MSWRVIGASVQGASHVRTGTPCQDAHRWREIPGGILLAAVSDGAGSAARAELGAATAVEAAIGRLSEDFAGGPGAADWEQILRASIESARQALEQAAKAEGCPLRDLAATLTVLAAGPGCVAGAQVGDCGAVIREEDGTLSTLLAPQAGEYINETTFLVSPGYLDAIQTANRPAPARELALFSDGLQRLALRLPAREPHAPFFAPLFRFASGADGETGYQEELARFLASERVSNRSDDDITLLLAIRR